LAGPQFSLAGMYADGRGVPKSEAAALEWYEKAAAQGLDEAQVLLGNMYENGKGAPKNDVKAVEWYQKAAAGGNTVAQSNLASRYATGAGVPKDLVIAYAWLNIAAASGDPKIVQQRDEFEKQLTKEQKAKAEKLAVDFFAKMPKK